MLFRVGVAIAATIMVSPLGESLANPLDDEADKCPTAVRGVAVSVSKVSGGVRIEFTAPSTKQSPELLLVIREAAAFLEYHTKLAALQAEQSFTADVYVPPVDITVKKLAKGAQVTVRPDESHDAALVVVLAKTLKERWDASACVTGKRSARLTRGAVKT